MKVFFIFIFYFLSCDEKIFYFLFLFFFIFYFYFFLFFGVVKGGGVENCSLRISPSVFSYQGIGFILGVVFHGVRSIHPLRFAYQKRGFKTAFFWVWERKGELPYPCFEIGGESLTILKIWAQYSRGLFGSAHPW